MSEHDETDLRCERVRLLLSLRIDEHTTTAQEAEIDAHLPSCVGCRAAEAADRAVRARCAAPAAVPAGFGQRIAAAARRQRLETRAQNRFLVAAAAAAVLVAAVSVATLRPADTAAPDGASARAVRESAGRALRAGLALDRSPLSGKEDR